MKLLNKLEKKLGKFAIRGLMLYIVSLNLAVFLLMKADTGGVLVNRLMLYPERVMQGELWRLVTYLFIPPTTSILWILFTLYFYYMIGAGLEQEWGSFKFNLYYFIGMVGTILAAFISGGAGTAFYLNLSLFLAFAYIYPNYQILLFFIIPIKIKLLAWLDAAFMAYAFFKGDFNIKLTIAFALVNFILFFGGDIVGNFRRNGVSLYRKKKHASNMAIKRVFHKCTVCGRTEQDDRTMEFRYCSGCDGEYEYCMEHLKNHEHIHK